MDSNGDFLQPGPDETKSFSTPPTSNPDITAYSSFDDLFDKMDLRPFENGAVAKIVEEATYQEPSGLRSVTHARAEIARLAFISLHLGDNYMQSLSPGVLNAIATYAQMAGFDEYTKEQALQDFYGALHVEATASLIGVGRDGDRLYKNLFDTERHDFPHFYAELSKSAGNFQETTATKCGFIKKIADFAKDTGNQQLIKGLSSELHTLLATDSFDKEQVFVISNKLALLAAQSVRPLFAEIDDFTAIAQALPDSEILAFLRKPENLKLQAMINYHPRIIQDVKDLTPQRIQYLKEEVDNFERVLPELRAFTEALSQAMMRDSQKVAAISDRKPDENDTQYEARIHEILTHENETPEEMRIMAFLSQDELDLHEDPLPLLHELSQIIGSDLQHATVATPHTYALENLVTELAGQLEETNTSAVSPDRGQTKWYVEGEDGQKITRVTPNERILKSRILVQCEGESDVAEFNYLTGEWKSSGVVEDGWPNVNVLNRDHYAKFERIMKRISRRNFSIL